MALDLAQSVCRGVKLTGLDISRQAEKAMRIFVAVEVVDEEIAPTHVCVVVRDSRDGTVEKVVSFCFFRSFLHVVQIIICGFLLHPLRFPFQLDTKSRQLGKRNLSLCREPQD